MEKYGHVAVLVPVSPFGAQLRLHEGRNLITTQHVSGKTTLYGTEGAVPLCYITIDEVRHFELRAFGSQDIEVNGKYLSPEKSVWLAHDDELGFLLPKFYAGSILEVCWHRYRLLGSSTKTEKIKRPCPNMLEDNKEITKKGKRYKRDTEGEDTADTYVSICGVTLAP